MTRGEFKTWLTFHTGAFRDLLGWFANMSAAERESVMWQHWYPVLESVELRDAKSATSEMFADESGKFAGLFAQTPANVRRVSRRITQRRIQAETIRRNPAKGDHDGRRYRCRVCWDQTIVSVWHPEVVRQIIAISRDGKVPHDWRLLTGAPYPDGAEKPVGFTYSFGMSCSCCSDDVVRNRQIGKFDERRFVIHEPMFPEKILEHAIARPMATPEAWQY